LPKLAGEELANLRLTVQGDRWNSIDLWEEGSVRRRKQLKCPFDSEEALEAKGKNAKAKGPDDQSTQSLTSLSTLEDGNDVAYAIEKSETKDEEHHSMADQDGIR
jgi:hypothetical protein